jgi:hypothetical protein
MKTLADAGRFAAIGRGNMVVAARRLDPPWMRHLGASATRVVPDGAIAQLPGGRSN